MKIKFIYVISLVLIFAISFGQTGVKKDSTKIKSIEIMSYFFNHAPRFDIELPTILNLRNIDKENKKGFYTKLNESESLKLYEKIKPLLTKDTIAGVLENNMDLRFLMVLNFEDNPSPVYIGFERSERMFINKRRYNPDKMFLMYSLDYITNKGIKKNIKKTIKNWK